MWKRLTKAVRGTERPLTKEWLLSPSDINVWRSKISMEHRDGSVLSEMLAHLRSKALHIGSETITGGLIQCLHEACLVGSYRFVEYIVQKHLDSFDLNRLNIFHPSKYFDSPAEDASPSDKAKHRRETLLHAAVIGKAASIVKLLMRFGASVNVQNCCSKTPLIVALEEQNEEIVSILLDEYQIDVNYCDNQGLTPLMYSVRIPAMIGFIPKIIRLGANLSITDSRGFTVLHIAFAEGTPKAVCCLIKYADSRLLCTLSSLPYAYALIDQNNFYGQVTSTHYKINLIKFIEVLNSLPANTFSTQWYIDLCLLKASWYMAVYAKSHTGTLDLHVSSLVNCKHALYEAFTKANLECDTYTNASFNEQKELQTLHDVKKMYADLSGKDLILTLFYQSLIVRERCLGYGDPTLIYCLLWFGEWLIRQYKVTETPCFEEGLSLWLRGTEMLLHCIEADKPLSSGISNLVITILHKLAMTHQRISPSDEYLVNLFGEYLCQHFLTPIVANIIKCVGKCVAITKNRHTHLITSKSFLSGVQLLLDILYGYTLINPEGLNLEYFVQILLENCPKIVIDANGLPSTIVHILLQQNPIQYPEKLLSLLLENDGQWMVNGIGPLGIRPLHLTHRKEVITLLLEYGAHLDSVNAYGVTAIKDLHTRMPDLFSEPVINSSPTPLKCLSAGTIANHKIPYAQLHIPPQLKKFISLHDRRAQDALLKGELEFVFY